MEERKEGKKEGGEKEGRKEYQELQQLSSLCCWEMLALECAFSPVFASHPPLFLFIFELNPCWFLPSESQSLREEGLSFLLCGTPIAYARQSYSVYIGLIGDFILRCPCPGHPLSPCLS